MCFCRPFVGGVLAKPADTWPGTFGKVAFFHQFPYFLSCAAGALVAIIAFAFVASGFKEVRLLQSSRMNRVLRI